MNEDFHKMQLLDLIQYFMQQTCDGKEQTLEDYHFKQKCLF